MHESVERRALSDNEVNLLNQKLDDVRHLSYYDPNWTTIDQIFMSPEVRNTSKDAHFLWEYASSVYERLKWAADEKDTQAEFFLQTLHCWYNFTLPREKRIKGYKEFVNNPGYILHALGSLAHEMVSEKIDTIFSGFTDYLPSEREIWWKDMTNKDLFVGILTYTEKELTFEQAY